MVIAFIYVYTKYFLLYLIQNKSQTHSIFKSFKIYFKNQVGFSIKSIQTDNAKEFLYLSSFLVKHGVQHCLIFPNTYEHNGSIGRKHSHIIDMELALLLVQVYFYLFGEKLFVLSLTL